MQRIGAVAGLIRNAAIDLFGAGKHGFKPGSAQTSDPASTPGYEWFNAIQEEGANIVELFGFVLDPNKRDQQWRAIASRTGTAGGLTFRNLLINAAGTINQRGYVSGAATSSANQYTLDRWRVVVSGQKLSWTASGALAVMTAPAGGVEQVIEGANILGGTYTLSWTGTATAMVNGSAVANGAPVTLPANANATVRFSGGTFSQPQLEQGAVATAFELRLIAAELALCLRYCEKLGPNGSIPGGWFTNGTSGSIVALYAQKRIAPALVVTGVTAMAITDGFGAGAISALVITGGGSSFSSCELGFTTAYASAQGRPAMLRLNAGTIILEAEF